MKLALLQYRITRHASFAAWQGALHARLAESAGADLLVLPEYACLDAIPVPLPSLGAELATALALHDPILDTLRDAATRLGVWIAGGSLPYRRADGAIVNHAPLVAPGGGVAFQDKHRPVPFERAAWGVADGAPPAVFDTPWGRIGLAICYDIEHPPLARAAAEAGAWLLLVPTDTDTVAGFNRVRLAARAAAVSNQCYVALCTTVGDAPFLAFLDENRGYAAVFSPVDRGFPEHGVVARTALDDPGWLVTELDPAAIAHVRAHGDVRNHQDYPPAPPPCPAIRP